MTINYEDGKWINNVGVYFAILKHINDDIIKLIAYEGNNPNEIEVLFFELISNLNRMIPMKYKKISYKDGILKLQQYLEFLKIDYDNIYNLYKDELIVINYMRNKFEYTPHIIKWIEYVGNNNEKKMWFINDEYNNDIIENNVEEIMKKKKKKEMLKMQIDTKILVNIIVSLNDIFIKIQIRSKECLKNNKEALNHPYIKSILEISLSNYSSNLKNNAKFNAIADDKNLT